MRVLINGVTALRPKTGIGHYIESLCEHFPATQNDDCLELFPGALARRLVSRLFRGDAAHPIKPALPRPARWNWKKAPTRLAQRVGSLIFRQAFRAAASRLGCDLYHEPNYIPWRCDLPALATVHDLSVLLFRNGIRPIGSSTSTHIFFAAWSAACISSPIRIASGGR